MEIAVLGGGNGSLAAAVDLTEQGHRVRLWRRDAATVMAMPASALSARAGFTSASSDAHPNSDSTTRRSRGPRWAATSAGSMAR